MPTSGRSVFTCLHGSRRSMSCGKIVGYTTFECRREANVTKSIPWTFRLPCMLPLRDAGSPLHNGKTKMNHLARLCHARFLLSKPLRRCLKSLRNQVYAKMCLCGTVHRYRIPGPIRSCKCCKGKAIIDVNSTRILGRRWRLRSPLHCSLAENRRSKNSD